MMSRSFMKGWKRAAVSAALAYALALQAVLFATSGALHAAPANLSQGVICLSDPAASDHAPGKAHQVLCCILGCHGSGAPGGPLPVAASLDHLDAAAAVAASPSRHTPFLRLASNVLPVGSRAPPRLG
jgi:hypothetical protein